MRCEDKLNLFSHHLSKCGPLHSAFPRDVVDACTNIQQVTEEDEEDTPHVDT
jgi:hypothetical protein